MMSLSLSEIRVERTSLQHRLRISNYLFNQRAKRHILEDVEWTVHGRGWVWINIWQNSETHKPNLPGWRPLLSFPSEIHCRKDPKKIFLLRLKVWEIGGDVFLTDESKTNMFAMLVLMLMTRSPDERKMPTINSILSLASRLVVKDFKLNQIK